MLVFVFRLMSGVGWVAPNRTRLLFVRDLSQSCRHFLMVIGDYRSESERFCA
jgi:hypothetical protein